MPELADWCGVDMPDRARLDPPGRGRPQRPRQGRVRARARPALPDPHERRRRRGAGPARRPARSSCRRSPTSCSTAAVEDPEQLELLRGLGMRSVVMVPMVAAGGTPIGVISFVNAESGRRVHRGRPRAVRGDRAAAPASRSRTRGSTRERSTIARTLQRALLPPALPEIPGFGARHAVPAGGRRRTGSAATSTTPSRSTAAGWWWSATSPAAARRPPR